MARHKHLSHSLYPWYHRHGGTVSRPQPGLVYSVDCSHASTGLFLGVLVLVTTIVSLAVFFVFITDPVLNSSVMYWTELYCTGAATHGRAGGLLLGARHLQRGGGRRPGRDVPGTEAPPTVPELYCADAAAELRQVPPARAGPAAAACRTGEYCTVNRDNCTGCPDRRVPIRRLLGRGDGRAADQPSTRVPRLGSHTRAGCVESRVNFTRITYLCFPARQPCRQPSYWTPAAATLPPPPSPGPRQHSTVTPGTGYHSRYGAKKSVVLVKNKGTCINYVQEDRKQLALADILIHSR